MTDWIDPKEFKRLWSSLVKAGWRTRRASGLGSDHTYVKAGVKGNLRQAKVGIDYFIEEEATVAASTVVATEQAVTVGALIMAATEQEACDRDDDEPGLDKFDRDYFMEAFRAENLFGPVDVDDVNIGDESFLCSAESDDEDSVFDEHEIDDEEYVDDVESDPEFEDASQNLRQNMREIRELASSGWEIYDQGNCAIAQQTHERQLAAQAKDPKKSVEDIIDKLERQKPIREHNILHVIGLLVARTLCGHKDGLSKHWTISEEVAVPLGTFKR
ncbi:uncharacterized protein PITG_14877 [Phytophthora infestans T30-4]|uniref:PiggyBac transposable element-derived protein domain-containing protein n=1 Tax=Phytophthora infestans (strain T30-4) TaxID=403677 RepID=D0NP84_PHYIT|nr:uncharacterized protein PITG_14877 [Phytophthora infestans T30-4]EEY62426.1 conserved hypothetical protein [Phytophthora infestans T30-4]|eukprot:XP_002899062.1 conserved hypothetical protein [Phytophthora infestans T30-4]